MTQKTYARLVDGVIAEYPVFEIHIKNRSHPFHWYTECVYDDKPELPDAFHYLKEHTKVVFNKLRDKNEVRVSYSIKEYTLTNLLNKIYKTSPNLLEESPNKNLSEIDPALATRIMELADKHIIFKLDEFAKTRRYDSLISLCLYRNDINPTFAAEAERGATLRSLTWQAANVYITKLMSDQLPVPKTVKDIEAQLPALTWE